MLGEPLARLSNEDEEFVFVDPQDFDLLPRRFARHLIGNIVSSDKERLGSLSLVTLGALQHAAKLCGYVFSAAVTGTTGSAIALSGRWAFTSLHLSHDIGEIIPKAPSDPFLVSAESDETSHRFGTRLLRESLEQRRRFGQFPQKTRKVRSFTEAEIRGLLCSGLDESEQQIDDANEIAGRPLVVGDGRRPVAKANRPSTERIWIDRVPHEVPVFGHDFSRSCVERGSAKESGKRSSSPSLGRRQTPKNPTGNGEVWRILNGPSLVGMVGDAGGTATGHPRSSMIGRLISIAVVGTFAAWLSLRAPSTPTTAGSIRSASADIAFASRRDGDWEIYVMDEAGRNPKRLTRRPVEDRFPLWSPDRRQIAFASQVGATWELWVMEADGSNQRRLASGIIAKSTRGWSPDGKRIAFAAVADGNIDIHTVEVPSARVTRLTSAPGEDRDPSWSPDGAHLAFSSTRGGTPQIFVMTADGRDVQRLASVGSPAAAPRWSPDGKAIALVSGRDRTQDLYIIGANGQGLVRLTVAAGVTGDPPLWSSDGSRIIFQIANGKNYDIGVVRISERSRSLLASSSAYDGSYTWSPDGKRVAFISGRDGNEGVYTVDADGRNVARLTGTASLTPAWGSQR